MQFTTYILATFTLISAALANPVDLVEREMKWCGNQEYDTTKVTPSFVSLQSRPAQVFLD